MKLYIKNMVCDRCIIVVRQQLEELGYAVKSLKLGEAEIEPFPDKEETEQIREAFLKVGFELVENKKQVLSEKIKALLIEKINKNDLPLAINISEYLSSTMDFDYHYLSHLFSETEGTTIEKFLIVQKTEKIKALLGYDELSISEIAWKMGYSSVQALSNQFKKATGLTPSEYKRKCLQK
jgi:AraC family transcriptional regulator